MVVERSKVFQKLNYNRKLSILLTDRTCLKPESCILAKAQPAYALEGFCAIEHPHKSETRHTCYPVHQRKDEESKAKPHTKMYKNGKQNFKSLRTQKSAIENTRSLITAWLVRDDMKSSTFSGEYDPGEGMYDVSAGAVCLEEIEYMGDLFLWL